MRTKLVVIDLFNTLSEFESEFSLSSRAMPSANLLWAEWISFSASVSLLGLLCLQCSQLVPETLQLVFRYGKTVERVENKVYKTLEIPKK